jgi:hypothetical protein
MRGLWQSDINTVSWDLRLWVWLLPPFSLVDRYASFRRKSYFWYWIWRQYVLSKCCTSLPNCTPSFQKAAVPCGMLRVRWRQRLVLKYWQVALIWAPPRLPQVPALCHKPSCNSDDGNKHFWLSGRQGEAKHSTEVGNPKHHGTYHPWDFFFCPPYSRYCVFSFKIMLLLL